MREPRIAIFYESRLGRNDGPPFYYYRALCKIFGERNVEHLAPTTHEEVAKFGEFDLYLWVDWGEDALTGALPYEPFSMEGYENTVYITSDTHLGFDYRLKKAREFDHVFCNQKRAVTEFLENGVEASWLPHAVDLQAYNPEPAGIKKYDVGFVGYVSNRKRAEALDVVFKRFPNFWYGQRLFEEASMIYKQSRVVFNNSVLDDINMRFFEVLGCGGILVTEDLPTFLDLDKNIGDYASFYGFEDWESACDVIQHVLDNPKYGIEKAKAGMEWVHANHTYDKRVEDVLVPLIEMRDSKLYITT